MVKVRIILECKNGSVEEHHGSGCHSHGGTGEGLSVIEDEGSECHVTIIVACVSRRINGYLGRYDESANTGHVGVVASIVLGENHLATVGIVMGVLIIHSSAISNTKVH